VLDGFRGIICGNKKKLICIEIIYINIVSMPIAEKIKSLKKIKDYCDKFYKLNHCKYKKYKRIDEGVDFFTSILNATSITLILSTPALPPLFIASAVCSSLQFVICRAQDKMKVKDKYNQYLTTARQYDALRREILTVLSKNHLSNEQYEAYIEEVHDKINLIKDNEN
jgi:hypothetical protein